MYVQVAVVRVVQTVRAVAIRAVLYHKKWMVNAYYSPTRKCFIAATLLPAYLDSQAGHVYAWHNSTLFTVWKSHRGVKRNCIEFDCYILNVFDILKSFSVERIFTVEIRRIWLGWVQVNKVTVITWFDLHHSCMTTCILEIYCMTLYLILQSYQSLYINTSC